MASSVVADYGRGQPFVDGWASLGAHGRRKGNCHRDLRKWAKTFDIDLDFGFVKTPVRNLRDHGTIEVDHAILYPHEVFAAAWEKGENVFKQLFCPGGHDELIHFWRTQRDHPWVKEHPGFCEFQHDRRWCCPLGVHADKGQHIKRDKILAISWGGIMCRKATDWSRILFTIIPDEILIPGVTDERVYSALTWSFQWLLRGEWPPTDHDGNPWPYGSRRYLNGIAAKPLAGEGSAWNDIVGGASRRHSWTRLGKRVRLDPGRGPGTDGGGLFGTKPNSQLRKLQRSLCRIPRRLGMVR